MQKVLNQWKLCHLLVSKYPKTIFLWISRLEDRASWTCYVCKRHYIIIILFSCTESLSIDGKKPGVEMKRTALILDLPLLWHRQLHHIYFLQVRQKKLTILTKEGHTYAFRYQYGKTFAYARPGRSMSCFGDVKKHFWWTMVSLKLKLFWRKFQSIKDWLQKEARLKVFLRFFTRRVTEWFWRRD